MAIRPRDDQIENLVKRAPDGPLYMLNLLKFKEKAEYADGRETNLTGAQAYALYGAAVGDMIGKMGGKRIFAGVPNTLVIGENDIEWDMMAIIEYPSLDAFRQMTASGDYQEAHAHREAGLDFQLLINCLSAEQAQQLTGSTCRRRLRPPTRDSG